MDKLERAKTWCPECGTGVPIDEDGCCTMCGAGAVGPGADQALRLLDAVEGVEEWMVEWLTAPDTDQAWEHVPEDLTVKVGEEPRWTRVDARIADTLQAILDAKGGG